jgi:hypothetical protein
MCDSSPDGSAPLSNPAKQDRFLCLPAVSTPNVTKGPAFTLSGLAQFW